MLYVLAIVLGIVIGVVFNGKVANILDLKFDKAWIIISAFIAQIAAQVLANRGLDFVANNSMLIQGMVFCLLFIGFWFNRHYAGILTIGLGSVLNALAMMFNGGKMPVSYDILDRIGLADAAVAISQGADMRHTLITESTRLVFLSDIIHPPYFLGLMMKVVSIGDIIVAIGLFLLVFESVTAKKLMRRNKFS